MISIRGYLTRKMAVITALFCSLFCTFAFMIKGSNAWPWASVDPQRSDCGPAYKYTGAGSCSSSSCHGAVSSKPSTESRIQGNEYSTWVVKDRHSRAYRTLTEERSRRIAKNLRLQDPPEKSAKCLDCHGVNVPDSLRSKSFDMSDGVGCESCHGPAECWLGPHTTKGWSHEQSLRAGMVDTRDPVLRARVCLSCHLGDETRTVDHEMIAAGHPDLLFELDTFSAAMPVHWRESEDNWNGSAPKSDSFGAKAWATGQAVALSEAMKQLSRRVAGKGWPEYAEFKCYECHHDLREPSWRQNRGYTSVAGRPTWNSARYAVLRHLVQLRDPEKARELEEHVATLERLLGQRPVDGTRTAEAAQSVSRLADRLALEISATPVGADRVRALLRSISADGKQIALGDVGAAEQACMSLEALYAAYAKESPSAENAAVRKAIAKLYEYLDRPERFSPAEFVSHMNAIHALIR